MSAKFSYRNLGMFTAAGLLLLLGLLTISKSVRAGDDQDDSKIRTGLRIAPVPLNLYKRNITFVGLGSYIVNAQGDCNGCHTSSPADEFAEGGNPYLLPPAFSGVKRVNQKTYLGGGRDFGTLIPGSAHIISRNLTPDKTGRPAGGLSFSQFLQVMRYGTDFDHLHPNCSGAPNENCLPAPFNGDLLQIMPWVSYQSMAEQDLRAIYEYLSAVPCIAGPATGPLHNDCN